MLSNSSPILNLHGETRDTAGYILETFIRDNVKLRIEYIGVIHGRSSNILKDFIHDLLKKNKNVDSYKVDIFNPGITVVKLKIT